MSFGLKWPVDTVDDIPGTTVTSTGVGNSVVRCGVVDRFDNEYNADEGTGVGCGGPGNTGAEVLRTICTDDEIPGTNDVRCDDVPESV